MIDSQINIKLIERFSPKGSLLDKHHQRLLEILIYFDKICRDFMKDLDIENLSPDDCGTHL